MTDLQFEFAKENEGIFRAIPRFVNQIIILNKQIQSNCIISVKNRLDKCVEIINNLMGYALGSVYVERVFDDESIEEVIH